MREKFMGDNDSAWVGPWGGGGGGTFWFLSWMGMRCTPRKIRVAMMR
jgi:hypothetical protein